ncbi:MAG TPA: HEAT repeat domain-containing protein, partial [Polyangiaceae bacterium LLY-WYZ-15_(1-7)]|nr:HEAT repeat domain-containing protein [Polyangiaceae bacterium LLY-WYZ-15_(1-7)]
TVALVACHAAEDDPAGQAEELSDPVRRTNAIRNLQKIWSNALREADGDRSAANVREVADAVIDKLAQAYIDNRMDNQNGLAMLQLMKEMEDPRALPALVAALDWRAEVNEEHAIRAAQTIQILELEEGQKADVASALGEALEKVRQARPVDNRLRVEMIRALGSLDSTAATPHLTKVATQQIEEQNFLINRLAAQQLGELGDPEAVDEMILGLYLFAPSNPGMRMNDVAAEALVRIGQPSLQPLLATLRGENEAANDIAEAYIEAVRQRDEQAAERMSVEQHIGGEATYALGALGFREAFDPLFAETEAEDTFRRLNGAIALVRLNMNESDLPRVRERLQSIYTGFADDAQSVQMKAQLTAAMRSLYDPGYLDFFLEQAKEEDNHPVVRLEAMSSYALLANKAQAEALQAWLAANEDDPYHDNFSQTTEKALATAIECDEDVQCYIGKLDDEDKAVIRKAAFMLGRLGRGNEAVIEALVGKLDHGELEVRMAAVQALDRVATEGSEAAIEKIEQLREQEQGRAIWNQFAREALPIEARLRARMQ